MWTTLLSSAAVKIFLLMAMLVTTLLKFYTRLSVVAEQLYKSVDSLETAGLERRRSQQQLSQSDRSGQLSVAEVGQGVAFRIMEVQQ